MEGERIKKGSKRVFYGVGTEMHQHIEYSEPEYVETKNGPVWWVSTYRVDKTFYRGKCTNVEKKGVYDQKFDTKANAEVWIRENIE